MFPMKIFKLIFWFTIISFFTSCGNNLEQNKIKTKFDQTSNFGRFLSTKYSLKVGDNENASKIISKSKHLQSDLILAELNFNSYLINGDFDKASEFKLIAPSQLSTLPMYTLPDFVLNLKKGVLINTKDFSFIKNQLPGFNMIFERLNYFKLVESGKIDDYVFNLKKSNIFDLLIFENTKIENQIYLSMPKKNLSLVESILYLEYLKRKYPQIYLNEINNFSLKFNYDVKYLELFFENNIDRKVDHKYIFANLFSYLSLLLSSQNNVPNSYLKILHEISHFLEPTLGKSNFYIAQLYTNENNYEIALDKLNRIEKKSLMFLDSNIRKYEILKIIDKKKSDLFIKSIQEKYPESSKVMFLIANNYRNENKCEDAIKIYNRLIKKSVNKYNYYYFKAICLDKLGKWKESKKILTELVSKNPNNAYVLNYLSYSMAIRNENLISAKKLIYRALEIEKNNGYFLDTLGWIQFKLNDIENAIKTIQLAIEIEPDNSEIIDHLGDIYYKIGRKKEAIFEWNRALIGNSDYELKKSIRSKLKKHNK